MLQPPPREWRVAVLALIATIAVLVLPIAFRGEVLVPDDGRAQVGLDPAVVAENLGGRRLGDASNYYVPETHHHLHGDSSASLSLWNPHVQLGRPSSHLAGVSPAYLPSRVLGWFVDDAHWFHTILALATIAGTAAFLFAFLGELGLGPWSCYAGAASLATGTFAVYWAPFPIFLAGLCWTSACLWLVARWLRRPSFGCAVGLAFATHALLLSAYPQQIVWHAWLVAGFAIARWWGTPGRRVAALAGLAACAVLGALAAAPVYADVALQAARSARVDVDRDFFLASLPRLETLRDHLRFLASMVDAFVATDPYDPAREREFNGVSLGPACAAFVALSLAPSARRRAAGWLAFAAIAVVLTIWPAAYLFGVDHLGLSLSRFRPQAAALIPLSVAAAIGVDALWRSKHARLVAHAGLAISPLVLAAACARADAGAARWIALGLVAAGAVALVVLRRRSIVAVLSIANLAFWSMPLLVAVPRSAIADGSPLVELVRERTADGSRFALAGERPLEILPPNREALYDLRSVHSYDSLSPRAFRDWGASVSDVGSGANVGWLRVHARWFQAIAGVAGYSRPAFSQSAVGLVIARDELASPALVPAGTIGKWRLYRPIRAPVLAAHVLDLDAAALARDEISLGGHVQDRATGSVEVVERRDDLWRVRLEPRAQPTLLFLSVQHHPHWSARAADSARLATVVVDGTFLGVRVPANCGEVVVRFEPWARWSWIPQVAFVLAFAASAARALLGRSRSALAA